MWKPDHNVERTFPTAKISYIECISGDSFIHILRFISEDFASFVNLLKTSKRLQHLAKTNDRILFQIEMRKKYDTKAPLFAAVHQGIYHERPPMVYNGKRILSHYPHAKTIWKDVKRMILCKDFSIYESRHSLQQKHRCRCKQSGLNDVLQTIESGSFLCACALKTIKNTTIHLPEQVKPSMTSNTVLGMLAHGNRDDVLKLVMSNKTLNVNCGPHALDNPLAYALLSPHRRHMRYLVDYLEFCSMLYYSDDSESSELDDLPKPGKYWEAKSLKIVEMLLSHPMIDVNQSAALYRFFYFRHSDKPRD